MRRAARERRATPEPEVALTRPSRRAYKHSRDPADDARASLDLAARCVRTFPALRVTALQMSPTIFLSGGYRFYFFSREEPRPHVHAHHAEGEAKFWLAPRIELARNHGLSKRRIAAARRLIEEHEDEIRAAWRTHFES
jgi:uncharacterized protein DUF4160